MKSRTQRGFSLTELMIALALSLILMAGVLSIFFTSKVTYMTNENTARLQENGRVALEMMLYDVRSSGYLGCARMKRIPFWNALNTPASVLWDFERPMQGFESTGAGVWTPALDAVAIGLNPVPANGSDVLAVRAPVRDAATQRMTASMANTIANPAVPTAPTNGQIMLITDCNTSSVFQATGYSAGAVVHAAPGAFAPGNSTTNLGFVYQNSAQRTTRLIPLQTVFYYVANSALYRKENALAAQLLVDGVDALQVAYGEDTNGDRVVDRYVSADGGGGPAVDWNNVIGVTVSLLMRSEETGTDVDTQTYTLLDPADAAQGGATLGPFNDRRQRMQFTSTATLRSYAR